MSSPVNATPVSRRTSQTFGEDADPTAEEKTIGENSDRPGHQGLANIDVAPESESLKKEALGGAQDGDFPDGGLRAWLVVLGVSQVPLYYFADGN